MSKDDLLAWLDTQATGMQMDMLSASTDEPNDYAYAMGAYEAYVFCMKHVISAPTQTNPPAL